MGFEGKTMAGVGTRSRHVVACEPCPSSPLHIPAHVAPHLCSALRTTPTLARRVSTPVDSSVAVAHSTARHCEYSDWCWGAIGHSTLSLTHCVPGVLNAL